MSLVLPRPEISVPQMALMTDDAQEILQFAADSFDEGFETALVTLVEIRGGAARALGAQMAVRRDGLYCGYVSGGCTEAAVAAEALQAIAGGNDRFLRLGEGSRFFDIVLPCGGGITLAIHVLRDNLSLRTVLEGLKLRRRMGLKYDAGAQSLEVAAFPAKDAWDGEHLSRGYRPRPRLLLSGRSIEAERTAKLAASTGYEVVRRQDGANLLDGALPDPDIAVVLLHHDLDLELPVLRAALDGNPFYIGALGSSKTHERRSAALKELGYEQAAIDRIKAPIGVIAKARDANTLALSVLGDVAAAYAISR
ncbi:XdhC family protein [Rhizobium sp. rho-13.1]|nr:XdhC family protein [Rhizobium sp. VS19-DR96]MBZ5765819.1 XdhC family protein [Rhizobium sp. VS19-DR129.2]MBZ5773903.1 XdhC family protein [Rhizobium sp. VS19-DRK62.2]MBZ5784975.1 XdhC family protein [Rhizobium sp. VS19-DR121]MBZ5801948.1 XdhC family protein [Rhizobium sp. VS19-DR181]MBZ5817684.1 XdhC family protein [Rhizobium sp. VS19-DR183]MBZ5831025.1 XdhC family protein [Rhizobium sp. VS19-DR104.2]MBZ5842225.1 XdhC family protein [Rhizobium sp. VS19-DR104.1]QXZ81783.1 XdhC family pro